MVETTDKSSGTCHKTQEVACEAGCSLCLGFTVTTSVFLSGSNCLQGLPVSQGVT